LESIKEWKIKNDKRRVEDEQFLGFILHLMPGFEALYPAGKVIFQNREK